MHTLVQSRASATPAADAILAPARTALTYHELRAQVDATVAALNRGGFGREDRIALALPDGPDLATAILAVAAGAVAMPANPAASEAQFSRLLHDANARAVVVQAGDGTACRAAATALGLPIIELQPAAAAGAFQLNVPEREVPRLAGSAMPDDTALLLHTSGTTGQQRRIRFTHRTLMQFASAIAAELSPDERRLNLFPLFHLFSFGGVLGTVANGSAIIRVPGFEPTEFFGWLDEFKLTSFAAVPTILQTLVQMAPAHHETIAASSLRRIRTGSATISEALLVAVKTTFGVPVLENYGLSETGPLTANPPPPRRKIGSVGISRGPEIMIVDEHGGPRITGETGEIVARGPAIIERYDDATADDQHLFLPGGWFRTGDLGYLDEDGYLFLTGRVKELINRGGEKIAPSMIEAALLKHPAVEAAVAFALPDERWGEEVAAAVVLVAEAPATEAEPRQFTADQLAPGEVPRRIIVIDEVPKGPTGKPQRIGLAATLGLVPAAPAHQATELAPGAPRSPIEAAVSSIFAEALDQDRVDRDDDFLTLSGDSIDAATIVSHLQDVFDVDLALTDLFHASSVAGVAALILERRANRLHAADVDRLLTEAVAGEPDAARGPGRAER